jgi:hypothetical protein
VALCVLARGGGMDATRRGYKVPAGYYRIRAVGRVDGLVRKIGVRVKVATALVTRHRHPSKVGTNTLRRGREGTVYFRNNEPRWGTLQIDCWGGLGIAVYRIRIPSRAFNVRNAYVAGRRDPYLDAGGMVHRFRERTRGGMVFRVFVENWAAFNVREVGLTYSYKKRI